ncbi:hypothetical protein ACFE04_011841 [Oxalis oulophora]
MVEEICMDFDEASSFEVKYHVKEKGYLEYFFLIYFKHFDMGLVSLFDNDSFRNFDGVLLLCGAIIVYVQHGIAINIDFISHGTRVVVGGFSDRVGANSSNNDHNEDSEVVPENLTDYDDDEELRSGRQKIKEKMQIRNADTIDVESDGDSDDSYETESDDEDLARKRRSKYTKFDSCNKIHIFSVGMFFEGGRRQFGRALDDYAIFNHVVYESGCPWRIYASYDNLQRLMQEDLGVSMKIALCRIARRKAMKELYGEIILDYNKLLDYVDELQKKIW